MTIEIGRPRVISFDLDDTLLDGSVWRRTIRRTCRRLAETLGLDAERLVAANAEAWERYWPTVEDRWTLGTLTGEALTREAWRLTLEGAGYDGSRADVAADVYRRQRADAMRLYPDVPDALAKLGRAAKLVLVTNGASDTQRAALRITDIEPFFAAIIVSGEVGIAKPDPAIFTRATEAVGATATETWHVGDGLLTDVAGARAAGLKAVWLNRRGLARTPDLLGPDLEIRSLTELADLVGAPAR